MQDPAASKWAKTYVPVLGPALEAGMCIKDGAG